MPSEMLTAESLILNAYLAFELLTVQRTKIQVIVDVKMNSFYSTEETICGHRLKVRFLFDIYSIWIILLEKSIGSPFNLFVMIPNHLFYCVFSSTIHKLEKMGRLSLLRRKTVHKSFGDCSSTNVGIFQEVGPTFEIVLSKMKGITLTVMK